MHNHEGIRETNPTAQRLPMLCFVICFNPAIVRDWPPVVRVGTLPSVQAGARADNLRLHELPGVRAAALAQKQPRQNHHQSD